MARSKVRCIFKKPSNARALALVVTVMAGLQGCSYPDALNPIEWYRDLTGASKNDDTANVERNSQNLDAGNKAPYPNLASVPVEPDRAMSTIDREKLQKGLVADRTNAQYSEDELRQGRPVPPLPGEAPAAQAGSDSSPGKAAQAGSDSSPAAAGTAAATPAAGKTKRPAAVKGAEQPPRESPLVTPTVSNTPPQGDVPHRAPPVPPGVGSQRPQPQPQPQPQQQPQQQLAAAPTLPSPRDVAPDRPAAEPAIMRAPRGKGPAVTLAGAEISFAADGRTLSADDNRRLAEVAKTYRQGAGSLRVIGYGRQGHGADAAQQVESFGEAMDRAGTVAQALAKLGVPAGRITIQTAPELIGGGLAAGRAEVLVEY
jgi:outer membrane protein OmpA-like peptidoglycan-associated protein